ncbi:MAG TPA: hypothetical protein VHO68_04440, partial [Bacteroidales bacterium]|nr:hypothetical protein [Bacteroidales bacterium]
MNSWNDFADALPNRFRSAYTRAASEAAPQARPMEIPKRVISNEDELDKWLKDIRELIVEKIK